MLYVYVRSEPSCSKTRQRIDERGTAATRSSRTAPLVSTSSSCCHLHVRTYVYVFSSAGAGVAEGGRASAHSARCSGLAFAYLHMYVRAYTYVVRTDYVRTILPTSLPARSSSSLPARCLTCSTSMSSTVPGLRLRTYLRNAVRSSRIASPTYVRVHRHRWEASLADFGGSHRADS